MVMRRWKSWSSRQREAGGYLKRRFGDPDPRSPSQIAREEGVLVYPSAGNMRLSDIAAEFKRRGWSIGAHRESGKNWTFKTRVRLVKMHDGHNVEMHVLAASSGSDKGWTLVVKWPDGQTSEYSQGVSKNSIPSRREAEVQVARVYKKNYRPRDRTGKSFRASRRRQIKQGGRHYPSSGLSDTSAEGIRTLNKRVLGSLVHTLRNVANRVEDDIQDLRDSDDRDAKQLLARAVAAILECHGAIRGIARSL